MWSGSVQRRKSGIGWKTSKTALTRRAQLKTHRPNQFFLLDSAATFKHHGNQFALALQQVTRTRFLLASLVAAAQIS
jgi:hypothetical protein